MDLLLDPERYAVGRLPHDAPLSDPKGRFVSVSRSEHELSVVCPESSLPEEAVAERGWRRLVVAGPLAFSEVGVLASLAAPLAEAEIPIFVISTYDTDHLLVKEEDLERSAEVLRRAGHRIRKPT